MRTDWHTLRRDFRRDRRGVFALWLGAALVPLTLFAAAGLDLMRSVDLRAQLQAAADSAALAGATAYTSTTSSAKTAAETVAKNYMAGAIAKLSTSSASSPPTYTATGGSTVLSSTVTGYTMTVVAQATMPSSLMKMWVSSTPVKVTAVATNPVYTLTSSLSNFSSGAWDANTVYWYVVPTDGGVPASSALTQLWSNTSSTNSNKLSASITAGQKIGFALKNVTGGIKSYGKNGYGGAAGSEHWFYSHLSPPSSQAYSSVTKDCSLQVVASTTSSSSTSSSSSTAPTTGSCLSTMPTYAAVNCGQAAGQTLTFYWNDMGGGSDDYDYNDAVFTVSCTTAATKQTGVVLTQ